MGFLAKAGLSGRPKVAGYEHMAIPCWQDIAPVEPISGDTVSNWLLFW